MYYRRKVLLALIEIFGGSLSDTDCNKLMFLFGQRTDRHYYDFFPYKYGAYSLVLYQDKLQLTDQGLLSREEKFRFNAIQSYLDQIKLADKLALQSLASDMRNIRGKRLLRRVYVDYPYFASRSEVASQVLSHDEYNHIRSHQIEQPELCLFTIGYEGLTIDAYLNKLIANNVQAVIDVRKNPVSMKYGFSKRQLQRYLENVGIAYRHIPELGIESHLRQNLSGLEDYKRLFDYYQSHILPNQNEALEVMRSVLDEKRRVALTCFEARHILCHRNKIAEHFSRDPTFAAPIVHL